MPTYKSFGGILPETAAIKNIFAFHGVTAPHTRKPFTEAMLLGIGGGLGSMYILWEFERHDYPSIVLGFRYRSNYTVDYLQSLCEQLGAEEHVFETAGKGKASALLEEVLAAGKPAIVWLDLGGEPYYFHYLLAGVAVVYGSVGGDYLVDSLASKPYRIPKERLAEARDIVPSFKNRLMVVEPSGEIDLENAIRVGIRKCIDYLGASSTSFSLPALRKWARLVMDDKNAKGWPQVFKGGRGLYGTLRTIYEAIVHHGTDGGGLRGLYADFLDEAAGVLGRDGLREAAARYRDLAGRWHALAEAALPGHVGIFKQTRDLVDEREAILRAQGGGGLESIVPLNDRLHEIKGRLNADFPLGPAETQALFADLSSRLKEIHESEKAALAVLAEALDR